MAAGDTALWLHNKLGSTDDLWSGKTICSQINQAKLQNIQACYNALQPHVKVKLMLSFLHLPRRNVEQWRADLEEILLMATHDTDQWVSMIGEILKTFPSMGTLNLDLEDNGIFSEMTSDLNKAVKKAAGARMLPLECQFLNKTALIAATGQQPQPIKHFALKRKPKSAILRAELLQKSTEVASSKKNNPSSSLPLKVRSFAKKMDDATPLKGLPNRTPPSSGFRSPGTSGPSRVIPTSTAPIARPTSTRKDVGIKNMADVMDLLTLCSELDEDLSNLSRGDNQRKERIRKHIHTVDTKLKYQVPDFEKDLQWLNISSSLSLYEHLKGNIVVLDFFTYCCINCVHVLPDLEKVEQKYSLNDGVIIIGVHSAKFENEKVSANILSAILRYNIHHPVVNDHDAVLWNKLQIQCWPTFVVVGPKGQFLQTFVGEGHRENLLEFIDESLEYFKDMINPCDLKLSLEKDKVNEAPLQFPGKVTTSNDGKILVVSDTGHHRILVLSQLGVVQHCIGGTDRGNEDGDFTQARFNSPQGVAINGDNVYVADAENHTIRQINLTSKTVRTLTGTGFQGQDKEGGKSGRNQELSSPWDVVLGKSPESDKENVLYIAMAGTHQIWVYFLQDSDWLKGSHYSRGTCLRFSGSGQEENRNNSYPTKAGFAQPSGLVLSPTLGLMFVADSESSTVRKVSLKDGGVKALVGGEFDPMNLFAYGDKDGKGYDCKLQHPLGVAIVTEENGPLLIADSYNHKIKSVDLKTSICKTVIGPETDGDDVIKFQLNEPGGLCVSQDKVYIADTNNHHIRVLDLKTQSISTLPVIFSKDETDSKPKQPIKVKGQIEDMECLVLPSMGDLTITLEITLPEGSHLTEDSPSRWVLLSEKNGQYTEEFKGEIKSVESIEICTVSVSDDPSIFYCQCKVLHCGVDNVCKMSQKTFKQAVGIDPQSSAARRHSHIHFSV